MKIITSLAVLAALVGGCGEESAAKDAVRQSLKDPDSAKFGKFETVKRGGLDWACLTVNAKNSMGGYTGDRTAFLSKKRDGKWKVSDIAEGQSMDDCRKIWLSDMTIEEREKDIDRLEKEIDRLEKSRE